MLLWRNDTAALFAYAQSRQRRGKPAAGIALKIKAERAGVPVWRHMQIGCYGAAVPFGRGCWSVEAATWRTSPTERKERIGVKAFLRVKLGLGGPRASTATHDEQESNA